MISAYHSMSFSLSFLCLLTSICAQSMRRNYSSYIIAKSISPTNLTSIKASIREDTFILFPENSKPILTPFKTITALVFL